MAIVKAEHIYKTYNHSVVDKLHHEKETPVLKDFNLSVNEADSICIMGKSGCGKTTLLKILGTIDKATTGNVFYDGINVNEISDADVAELRRKRVGFVFQDYNLLYLCLRIY